MNRKTLVCLAAIAVLATGCATKPEQIRVTSLTECSQLRDATEHAQDERRAAAEKKENAWKSVIPFVVVGQYINGSVDETDADERLTELGARAAAQGCAS